MIGGLLWGRETCVPQSYAWGVEAQIDWYEAYADLGNLPTAGWHQFKSHRKAIFTKAIRELHGMKTADGSGIEVLIRQGLNLRDFMVVASLIPPEISVQSA